MAYEVLPGNTSDNTTLPDFLEKIESRYGKARRIWLMDRGIPTEAHLALMKERGMLYLVGTPKGRLSKLEQALLARPWEKARPDVQVKLLPQDEDLYVWVQSRSRVGKERSMRRRRLKRLWSRLKDLQCQRPSYENLLLKLGAAKKDAGRAWSLVEIVLPNPPPRKTRSRRVTFTFKLNKEKLRGVCRREGRYLLRSRRSRVHFSTRSTTNCTGIGPMTDVVDGDGVAVGVGEGVGEGVSVRVGVGGTLGVGSAAADVN